MSDVIKSCIECSEDTHAQAMWSDPRIPPLEEGPCLCVNCTLSALDERKEELEVQTL